MTTFTPKAPPHRPFDWKGLAWLFLFFWYFSGVTQTLIQLTGTTGFAGFRDALLLSALWLIPVLLFPARTRSIAGVLGAILFLCSLLSLGYFLIYQQEFSQSVIFVLFESNDAEAGEYLSQYFAWWMVPAFLFYAAGAALLWTRVRPVYLSTTKATVVSLALLLGLVALPLYKKVQRTGNFDAGLESFQDRIEPAVPWQLLIGYQNYREQLNGMQAMLAANAKVPPLSHLTDSIAGLPATLVLVIGESTNRGHMSLYGYPRNTTPNLDQMRDQLSVFNNVVSPRPYTIESLQQVLTFADEQHPDLFLTTPTIVDVMKQAGYKTWWITNQQTLTKRNTMLTTFSQQADEQIYLNNNRNQNAAQYDGDVLKPFDKVLADSAPRKLIVIHLLGTHVNYNYRYPQEFAKFSGRDGTPPGLSDEQLATYNSYDNAVLYNDFVVSSIIKQFAATDPNGFLLYLSDHGEDVYDSGAHNNLGRNEGRPTAPMYTIPFMAWASPKWRATHPWNFTAALDRPYSSSSLIHTWADMAGLAFDEHDASKSLVSSAFVPRTRWIGDPYQPKTLSDFDQLGKNRARRGQ
ncbi:phosphoethanolamine transferase CptA [Pseudomonas typographi]|uniref:phosphoethanolamine transferase CptA n=1 Tax=Pseudomonas typographi TaxID=2715964 RepID=UPI0016875390|nr:phosphoethanolamine transferase CptA [Pseudomonas typographi]MBD1551350.1 phosphoethanolamine transferase CptA [Pseudomonas typographi]